MHRYSEEKQLPYDPRQLFDLVADVASYPQFLPWCRAARILSREGNVMIAELIIHFGHMTERYCSRVTLTPPDNNFPGEINVSLVSGPFKHLSNCWRFLPHPDGCSIALTLEFQFKSILLDRLMGGMFERACEKMIGAFTTRAARLYENHPPSLHE